MHHTLTNSGVFTEKLRLQGPCSNFYLEGHEMDYSLCIASKYWPQTAQPWIARCQLKQWPTQTLLREILTNGCHVMPIGSKLIDDESELEWRLSFSLAEQKLVYSFNHTQFLCYGMLKYFKRGFEFRETGIHNMFLLYEDRFALEDSEQSGRGISVSFKLTDLFLGVFQTPM